MSEQTLTPPEGKVERVWCYSNQGRYNLLSNEKQWQTQIGVVVGGQTVQLSEIDDEDPDITHQTRPSEVVGILEELNKRWIRGTNRQQVYNEKLKWFNERLLEMDAVWAKGRIERLREELLDMEDLIIRYEESQ